MINHHPTVLLNSQTLLTMAQASKYQQKKSFYQHVMVVYGRKPVLEALQSPQLDCLRLHLANSNRSSVTIMNDIIDIANKRNIEIQYHDRQALARISKNGKQDQGACLDIHCPKHQSLEDFLKHHQAPLRLLALENVTNPQNLGMILRSACAGNIDGIVIADKGTAKLDALVIKSSAGTVFRAPILRCSNIQSGLLGCKNRGAELIGLEGSSSRDFFSYRENPFVVYVLGNETKGLTHSTKELCKTTLSIAMNNGVESLNVAAVASLIAFKPALAKDF